MTGWERERERILRIEAELLVKRMADTYPAYVASENGGHTLSLEMYLCFIWDMEWERFTKPELQELVEAHLHEGRRQMNEERRQREEQKYVSISHGC